MKRAPRVMPEEIREVRRRLALTQNSFGQLLGVSGPLVCQWERGKREPDVLHTAVLEQMLCMTAGTTKIRDCLGLIPGGPLYAKRRDPEVLAHITLGVLFCHESAMIDPVRYIQLRKGTADNADTE